MDVTQTRLKPAPADDENMRPFGRLIRSNRSAGRNTTFYNDAVAVWDIPGMVTDEQACISIARVRPRPGSVIWMERHFKHTQVFMPVNGAPFTMVLAPPNDRKVPDLEKVTALSFDGSAGVMLDLGTWHEFPFAAEREAEIAVFLREETNANLEAIENGEAVGGDLEKRNVQTRLGVEFVI
ncbi:ureidoglycolate lyase [Altererythrobacter sp. MF3-039]|uniref:ureidoglycolate lyase n=1 Tax=Altererythrobacter sp. MF3-039 TaxID=3252901 RepID=UPI00390CBEC9